MPERTDQPTDQHSPGSPEPSNACRLMQAMAAYMEAPGNRGRLLTRVGVQRALAQAAEQTLSALPDTEYDEATPGPAALAERILADDGKGIEIREHQVRQLAADCIQNI